MSKNPNHKYNNDSQLKFKLKFQVQSIKTPFQLREKETRKEILGRKKAEVRPKKREGGNNNKLNLYSKVTKYITWLNHDIKSDNQKME